MTKLNIQRCCRKPDKAKCLLDAVESPCHSYIVILNVSLDYETGTI